MNNITELKPEVSIIIPVYNQLQYTLNCINAIEKNSEGINYEIIIVDDCSQDNTAEAIANISHIKYIQNQNNEGFIKSTNKGAHHANGNYLVFLNNDTEVQPGWLNAILDTFTQFSNAGIVGSKLVFGDGTLQEAGGIVWSDGSAWNYGRGGNPNDWKYNFLREVDYVTGACISIRKELFEQCGGFSELYLPAYYEDTDLCFQVRERGYLVYYQPKSEVIHFEGVSSGIDLTKGVKRHQVINCKKFYERWQSVLLGKHWPRDPDFLLRAKSHGIKPEVLIIDHKVPEEDKDAGSVRMLHIILLFLKRGIRVTFYSDTKPNAVYSDLFKGLGVEVIFDDEDFDSLILSRTLQFDLVWMARPNVSLFKLDVIRKWMPNVKIVYDTIDLFFLRVQRQSEIENNKELAKSAELYFIEELYLARHADYVITVTQDETKRLGEIDQSINTFVIPTIHPDPEVQLTRFEDREGIIFLGSYQHSPNVDAVSWFVNEVLPLIRKELNEIVFYILGSNPTEEILSLQKDGEVEVVGWVKDLQPWFEKSRVFVSPLRYGAGIKGKNGQSMSFGLPLVTTTIGAEGMNLIHGKHAMIADTAADFAEFVLNLYRTEDLWNSLSQNGKKLVTDSYSPQQVEKMMDELLVALFESTTGNYVRQDIQRLRSLLLHKANVINKRKEWLLNSLTFENEREVYIWGSGSGGKRTLQMLKEHGIEVKGFIDSDSTKEGSQLNGLTISSPQFLVLQKEKEKHPFVVIGSMYRKEIERVLYEMGFDLHDDVWANPQL